MRPVPVVLGCVLVAPDEHGLLVLMVLALVAVECHARLEVVLEQAAEHESFRDMGEIPMRSPVAGDSSTIGRLDIC